jgi:hypothetical protein
VQPRLLEQREYVEIEHDHDQEYVFNSEDDTLLEDSAESRQDLQQAQPEEQRREYNN